MPRLVHLPPALEGAIKVHLISKIHHIICETLIISQNSSHSQNWFINNIENTQYTKNPTLLRTSPIPAFHQSAHSVLYALTLPPDSQVEPNQQPRLVKKLERPDGSTRAFFYALKQNYCFPQGHTGLSYFQTAQIDRGTLCLNKILPVSQCIMDVEQFS